MKIFDISMPISYDMPVYKGREQKRPLFTVESNFDTGTVYESAMKINMHTGTHIDSKLHMVPNGDTIKSIPLNDLITECQVLDFTDITDHITETDLKKKEIRQGTFVLLKTRNTLEKIREKDYIYLGQNGAGYLSGLNIKGVGIDALGIERNQPGHETHLQLMEKNIHIIEGLELADVPEGDYVLIALPLNIPNAEASPMRAILIEKGSFLL